MRILRIVLDIDNVGRDFTGALTTQFLKDYPYFKGQLKPITQWGLDLFFPIGKDIFKYFNVDRPKEIFEDGPIYDGFFNLVRDLRMLGHKVVLCTSQLPGTEQHTLNWITKNGIQHDGVCFLADKSLMNCDILLDDGEHNLKAFRSSGGTPVAFDQPWNRNWDGLRVEGETEQERYDAFKEMIVCLTQH